MSPMIFEKIKIESICKDIVCIQILKFNFLENKY